MMQHWLTPPLNKMEEAPRDGTMFLAFYESEHGPKFGPMSWMKGQDPNKFDLRKFMSWALLTESQKAVGWVGLNEPYWKE